MKKKKNTVTWFRPVVAELFHPRLISMGYVADKVALGEVSLRAFRFSPVSKILPTVRNYLFINSPTNEAT
jgi:hypothetical protein